MSAQFGPVARPSRIILTLLGAGPCPLGVRRQVFPSGPVASGRPNTIAKRWLLVCAVLCAVLGVGFAYQFVRLWHPSPPRPPTESELSKLASRFPAIRGRLEQIVAAHWDGNRRGEARDSLLGAGETLRVRRAEQEYQARLRRLDEGSRPAGHDIICSDSLMYLAAWTRRGYGFSAPWHTAGYVYATRPPGDRSAWPLDTPRDRAGIGTPLPARYEHLGGRWYLYSMRDP